jgi:hypothetical protein
MLMTSVAIVNSSGEVVYHSHVFVHPSNVVNYLTRSELY